MDISSFDILDEQIAADKVAQSARAAKPTKADKATKAPKTSKTTKTSKTSKTTKVNKSTKLDKPAKTVDQSDVDESDINADDDESDVEEIDYSLYTPDGDRIIYITKSGAFINYSDVYPSESDTDIEFEQLDQENQLAIIRRITRLENYFTLRTMLITGTFKQAKRCKVDRKKHRIIVPRFGVYEVLNQKYTLENFTTRSNIKPGETVKYQWTGKLTDNQTLIAEHIMTKIFTKERVAIGSAGAIVNLEAGQGKSYLAAYLMSIIGKKAAVILHSTSLLDQWAKVIKSCYPDISIGYYYAKKKILGDVMLMIVDSGCHSIFAFGKPGKADYKEYTALEFYNRFGLLIFDECHEYANNADGQIFRTAQTPYMIGLSATPEENANKFDDIIRWEIGPVLNCDQLPGYQSTQNDFKGIVHRVNYYGPVEYTTVEKNEKTDMILVSSVIARLCEDEQRNNVIIQCIKKCMDLDLYTFVFADRREYLEILRKKLLKEYRVTGEIIVNDDDFIRVVGGAKTNIVDTAETISKVIFTTYQYMGTGRSIIKMNGLVLATPRKSKMKQYINRIFRLSSDSSITRHIYDIVDSKTGVSKQWRSRKKYYDAREFTIEEEKIYALTVSEWEQKQLNQSNTTHQSDAGPAHQTQSDITNPSEKQKITISRIEKIRNILVCDAHDTEITNDAHDTETTNVAHDIPIDDQAESTIKTTKTPKKPKTLKPPKEPKPTKAPKAPKTPKPPKEPKEPKQTKTSDTKLIKTNNTIIQKKPIVKKLQTNETNDLLKTAIQSYQTTSNI